jgi:hypothetical protein
MALPEENQMGMRVRVIVVASALVTAAWTPSLVAQRGQGDGAAAQAPQGRQGGAPGGGAAAGRGRGAAANLPPAGPVPRLANGKPDLSGLWANPYTPNMAQRAVDPKTREPLKFARQGEALKGAAAAASGNQARAYDLPYTEWGLKQWIDYDPVKNGDYAGTCLPFGMSRNINSPHGVQVIHHPDALAFLFEQNTWFHWVPTSETFKWPADLPETWNGLSTGRWDGDTLVIETSGFNGYTKLDTSGHPHSKQLKLTNTFRRLDSRSMEHTVTVHDPRAYTQDWMNVRTWNIKPAPDVIMEYSCEENNLDNIISGAITRWTPPADVD